ncbi:MAG TPA: response regulator transcription factor [Pyrinomonadaceae bacterium]|nr:response regulator transcription factor [Pyrinomonadaceae bacterium]
MKDLRVVIIEESDVIKEALRAAFAESQGCHLIGMATNPQEGLSLVMAEQPDVIMMDGSTPEHNIDLLRGIREIDQGVIIIIFTAHDSPEMRIACRKAGATFYVIKWQLRDLLDLLQLTRKLI